MTRLQLQRIENNLAKRGYKKWTTCLTSSESWAWFNTFDKQLDELGEVTAGYQVAFRVWDSTKYGQTGVNAYGLDVWSSAIGSDSRIDLTSSWQPICDIGTFERMAADFYKLTQKYLKR